MPAMHAMAAISMQVRRCYLGEHTVDTNDLCVSCGSNSLYSFNPANTTCDTCPENAYCNSTSGTAMVPTDAYWASSLLSTQVSEQQSPWGHATRCHEPLQYNSDFCACLRI